MGIVTPNIGIYIPAAGETNYQDSFAAGMVNIDQHDHSGGPNKGVRINSSGLADFSVTYNKLNADVVDASTGIGVNALLPNKLQILGLLTNIYNIPTVAGFIAKNGAVATARTFQSSGDLVWTNPAGVAGNPSIALASSVTTSVAGTANQIDVTAPGGVQTLSLSTNVVNGNQSAFKGNVTTPQNAVTGDSTVYTVLFGSVSGTPVFNQGANFDGTSTYTAPITGNYLFQTTLAIDGLSTAFGSSTGIFQFKVNGAAIYTMISDSDIGGGSGAAVIQGGQMMSLQAGDTVSVCLTVNNALSVKTVNIIGGDFTGLLLPA